MSYSKYLQTFLPVFNMLATVPLDLMLILQLSNFLLQNFCVRMSISFLLLQGDLSRRFLNVVHLILSSLSKKYHGMCERKLSKLLPLHNSV